MVVADSSNCNSKQTFYQNNLPLLILMTIVFFACNVAKLVSNILNVKIIFSFNITTGLLCLSS